MTIVKVCGITNVDDALASVDAGADLLGFIFYPKSPRYVTVERAREIVGVVSRQSTVGSGQSAVGSSGLSTFDFRLTTPLRTVGVFVNETPEMMLDALNAAGVDYAQLSGDEPVESLQALAGRGYKAARQAAGAEMLAAWIDGHPAPDGMPDLLLDAHHATLYGGSGLRADEALAARLARRCRLLLAGGLTPDNVAEAVRAVRPWGVDVSSGVEAAPGRKDHAKVRAFVAAAKAAGSRQ